MGEPLAFRRIGCRIACGCHRGRDWHDRRRRARRRGAGKPRFGRERRDAIEFRRADRSRHRPRHRRAACRRSRRPAGRWADAGNVDCRWDEEGLARSAADGRSWLTTGGQEWPAPGTGPVVCAKPQLLLQARVLPGGAVEPGAFVLQFVLQLVDLVFLHPQFAFEQLLAQVALAAKAAKHDGRHHEDGAESQAERRENASGQASEPCHDAPPCASLLGLLAAHHGAATIRSLFRHVPAGQPTVFSVGMRSITSSISLYSSASCADMKRSRSVSCSIFSRGCPVCLSRMALSLCLMFLNSLA